MDDNGFTEEDAQNLKNDEQQVEIVVDLGDGCLVYMVSLFGLFYILCHLFL